MKKVIRLTAVGFAPYMGYCGFEYAANDEMFFLEEDDAKVFIETCLSERLNGRHRHQHQSKNEGNIYKLTLGEYVEMEIVSLNSVHASNPYAEICTRIPGYIITGMRGYHAERERESDLFTSLLDARKASSELYWIRHEPFLEIKRAYQLILHG